MKSVRIQSYSDSHFPAFGVNTERYVITPNTDTFYAVLVVTLPEIIVTNTGSQNANYSLKLKINTKFKRVQPQVNKKSQNTGMTITKYFYN